MSTETFGREPMGEGKVLLARAARAGCKAGGWAQEKGRERRGLTSAPIAACRCKRTAGFRHESAVLCKLCVCGRVLCACMCACTCTCVCAHAGKSSHQSEVVCGGCCLCVPHVPLPRRDVPRAAEHVHACMHVCTCRWHITCCMHGPFWPCVYTVLAHSLGAMTPATADRAEHAPTLPPSGHSGPTNDTWICLWPDLSSPQQQKVFPHPCLARVPFQSRGARGGETRHTHKGTAPASSKAGEGGN